MPTMDVVDYRLKKIQLMYRLIKQTFQDYI